MKTETARQAKAAHYFGFSRASLYRACRDWHGYLSALAFIALIFFSLTGLILNHPEWTASVQFETEEQTINLDPSDLALAAAGKDPGPAIAALLGDQITLLGGFDSAEIYDGEAFLRFEGPKGSMDAVINLESGASACHKPRCAGCNCPEQFASGQRRRFYLEGRDRHFCRLDPRIVVDRLFSVFHASLQTQDRPAFDGGQRGHGRGRIPEVCALITNGGDESMRLSARCCQRQARLEQRSAIGMIHMNTSEKEMVSKSAHTAKLIRSLGIIAVAAGLSACVLLDLPPDHSLKLDASQYSELTVMLDGRPLAVRRYEAVYVADPIEMAAQQPARRMGPGGSPASSAATTLDNPYAYQSLYVFVPETATASSPMIVNVNNGGWFASSLRAGIMNGGSYESGSNTDKAGAALAAGYVYVDIGTRGRGMLAADGSFPGHAPAAVVDTKAAIRWLRLNDDALSGSAERIILTGTSGGGGLTAIVAASGDSPDYLPFLAEIGAAGASLEGRSSVSDAVFAAITYCPITDLGHADLAYEWLFGAVRGSVDGQADVLPDAQSAASAELAISYPAYLDSLNLKVTSGEALSAASMPGAIKEELVATIERHLASGGIVPPMGGEFKLTSLAMRSDKDLVLPNDWLATKEGKVEQLDLEGFLRFVAKTAALKAVPAFDRTGNTGHTEVDGENTLFGSVQQAYSNFTPYGWNNNEIAGDGSGPDDTGSDWRMWIDRDGAWVAQQLKYINPFAYLGASEARTAPYWYIRHGMIDRDASLATQVALAHAVEADPAVRQVNFALPWMVAHRGDYDVQEAYDWLASVVADAGPVIDD